MEGAEIYEKFCGKRAREIANSVLRWCRATFQADSVEFKRIEEKATKDPVTFTRAVVLIGETKVPGTDFLDVP